MTDEMFVKLMRECGTDEETIAELLAQERQQQITNLEPPLAQTAPSSFPRRAAVSMCSRGSIECGNGFNGLIKKKSVKSYSAKRSK